MKENKKVRKQENNNSAKKAIKKTRKNTLSTKNSIRKKSFRIPPFFFHKFPPLHMYTHTIKIF